MKSYKMLCFFLFYLCFPVIIGCATPRPSVKYYTSHTALAKLLNLPEKKEEQLKNARQAVLRDLLFTTNALDVKYLNVLLNLREQRNSILKRIRNCSDAQVLVGIISGFITTTAPVWVGKEKRENVMTVFSAFGTSFIGLSELFKHSTEIDITDKDIENLSSAYGEFVSTVTPLLVKSDREGLNDEELKQWKMAIINMDRAFARLRYKKSGVELYMGKPKEKEGEEKVKEKKE